jgi:transcriptional regulator with XRE-family HTH domain
MDAITTARAARRARRFVRAGLLREAREALGLTQDDLARLVGVKQPTISRWEAAKATPRARHAIRLAELLERADEA